jgi:hypothetical protein
MGYLSPRHYTVRLRSSERARYRIPRTVYEWLKMHQGRDVVNLAERRKYNDLEGFDASGEPSRTESFIVDVDTGEVSPGVRVPPVIR